MIFCFLQIWLPIYYNHLTFKYLLLLLLLLFSCPVVCYSLQPHGLQHARPLCPLPTPEVCPKFMSIASVMPSAISSSDAFFSFCLQPFPGSGTFPMSQLFALDDQNTGVSASVLPLTLQGGFPLKLTGLISLLSKGLSGVFSSTAFQRHQFFSTPPSF